MQCVEGCTARLSPTPPARHPSIARGAAAAATPAPSCLTTHLPLPSRPRRFHPIPTLPQGLFLHPLHLHSGTMTIVALPPDQLAINATWTPWYEPGDRTDTLQLPQAKRGPGAGITVRIQPGQYAGYRWAARGGCWRACMWRACTCREWGLCMQQGSSGGAGVSAASVRGPPHRCGACTR